MSSDDIEPFDWYRRFGGLGRRGIGGFFDDMFRGFDEMRVVVEMPGIGKENIKINAYDNTVEVKSQDPQRKYHRTIEIPPETDIETATSAYNNGILKITFNKKEHTKPKGKTIKVE